MRQERSYINILKIAEGYKTGKVENKNVTLSSWEKLTQDIKNEKIIQLLAYAYMFSEDKNAVVEAGIISFKNMKSGFMPFCFDNNDSITEEILEKYQEQMIVLINEIFNPEIPFEEKKV